MRFQSILLSMKWNNVLDIALVSYLIFKAVVLIRNTRAVQLLKGILMILLLYGVVRAARMEMMQMLFDSVVFQVGIVAIVVIFQPEIRRAIEQIGKTSISKFHVFGVPGNSELQRAQTEETIAAVSDACQILRNMKMGALMVFENRDVLTDIIKSGTIIEAKPSMELIGNIFFNKAPLHDGAMMVMGRVNRAN